MPSHAIAAGTCGSQNIGWCRPELSTVAVSEVGALAASIIVREVG